MSKPEAGWGTIAKGLLADGMVPAQLTPMGRDEIRAALDMVLQMSAERDLRLAAALRELDHAAEEIVRLRQQRDELLAALKGIIDVSKHNSEAELMFIAIRKIAEHATKPRE